MLRILWLLGSLVTCAWVGTFFFMDPSSRRAYALLYGALLAVLWIVGVKVEMRQAQEAPSPKLDPGPPHIHWPEAVTTILGEPTGRHICVECYDECPAPEGYWINNRAWVCALTPPEGGWMRLEDGEVARLALCHLQDRHQRIQQRLMVKDGIHRGHLLPSPMALDLSGGGQRFPALDY